MILRLPESPVPGKRVAEVVRLYDVAPTLLDFAGLPKMKEAQGLSVRPYVQGNSTSPRGAISQLSQVQQFNNMGRMQWRAQTQEVWRDQRFSIFRTLTCNPFDDGSSQFPVFRQASGPGRPVYLFFDRQKDPWERNNLPLTHPDFSRALSRYIADSRNAQKSQSALPASPASARYPQVMTEIEVQALAALGYTDAAKSGSSAAFRIPAFAPYPPPRKIGF
jgi:arylsulfatase A-like enzyme